ncbi:hypothetical protein FACS1894166_06870 [Bacilli bacterium]|nr:hypothetical protein FACS1894166_06870 [Bacilli bacterium]
MNHDKYQKETLATAHAIMKNVLILLQPHIPFASEQIYLELYHDEKSILLET